MATTSTTTTTSPTQPEPQYQVLPLPNMSFLDFFWWYLGFGGGQKFQAPCSTLGGVFSATAFECRKTIPADVIAARASAVTEIQNMDSLSATEKNAAIASINSATTIESINTIRTTNSALNTNRTALSALNAAKANATAGVNELTSLTTAQRDGYNSRITAATTSAEITAIRAEATTANQQAAANTTLLSTACTRAGFPSNCKITDLDRLGYECNFFGISTNAGCTKSAVEQKENEMWQVAKQTALPAGATSCTAPKTLLSRSRTCIEMSAATPAAQRGLYDFATQYDMVNPPPRSTGGACTTAELATGNAMNNYNNTGCHICVPGFKLRGTRCIRTEITNGYDTLPQPPNASALVEPFRNVMKRPPVPMMRQENFRSVPKNDFMQQSSRTFNKPSENFRNPPAFNRPLSNYNKNTMSSMDSSGMFCAPVNF